MAINLAQVAKQKGIKYFLISFVDLFGTLRAKLVPARAIDDMQKDGAGFAGFAAWLDMTPADPDMFGVPDPDSLIQLPWNPEVGWLAAGFMDERQSGGGLPAYHLETATCQGGEGRLSNDDRRRMRILPGKPGRDCHL